MKRQGDRAIITCESNNVAWEILCDNGVWHGDLGKCSESEAASIQINHCDRCLTQCLLLIPLSAQIHSMLLRYFKKLLYRIIVSGYIGAVA